MGEHGFANIDLIILIIYFLIVFGMGFIFSRSQKGLAQQFLAGRKIGWFVIGSSMFITTVSSEHVVGYPESGYKDGFAAGNFAWGACITVIILAWVFIPIFLRNKVFTLPEFIEKRFDSRSRKLMSSVAILAYIVTKVSVTLFAGAILMESLLGWDKYTSSLVLVILTGGFTVAGGFKGVLYTHVFHCYMLIFGATIVTIFAVTHIGGLETLKNIPADHIEVFKPNDHGSYPWLGMLLGAPILEIWYWCTDQYMVQRALSAKNIENGRRGAIFAGYLMLLPSFILLIPGLVAYVEYGPEVMTGKTFITIVSEVLPPGVKAIAVAGMLSALISSLAASFNSTATLFTMDFYKKKFPHASEFQMVNVGKIAVLAIVIISIMWVPFMNYFSEDIIANLQAVQSYIAPPFTAIFLVGLLWSRANSKGAYAVMVTGGVFWIFRMFLDFFGSGLSDGHFLKMVLEMNFLYQAAILFVFYVLLMVVVSLMTQTPDENKIMGLTFKFSKSIEYSPTVQPKNAAAMRRQDIIASVILMLFLLSIWVFLTV